MQTIGAWAHRLQAMASRAFAADDPEKPSLRARAQARLSRYLKMTAGFVLSVAVLGVGALYLSAAASRTPLTPPEALDVPAGGAQGVAAAQYLFGLESRGDDLAAERLFAPRSLKRREKAAFGAAQTPARAYVALLRVRRGARAQLLLDAREAANGSGRGAADALERLNAGAAAQRIVFDDSAAGVRILALEAAAACAARAAYLSERAHAEPVSRETDEAAFYQARGEALGWFIMLRAAAQDAAPDDLDEAALARTLWALGRAASYDPVLFPGGPRGGALTPNHYAVVGLDLAVAAQEARALAGP